MVVEQDRRPEEQQPQRSPIEQLFEALERAGKSGAMVPLSELEIAYEAAEITHEHHEGSPDGFGAVVDSLMSEGILPKKVTVYGGNENRHQLRDPIALRQGLQVLENIGAFPRASAFRFDNADLETTQEGEERTMHVFSRDSDIDGISGGVSFEPGGKIFSINVGISSEAYVASFGKQGK